MQKAKKGRLLLCGVASVGGLMTASHALAQQVEAQSSATNQPGDIVVTAQRRPQSLRDVPVSVSVVSGDTLQRGNINSLAAVSEQMPNVKITSGPLVDQINIRGVGSGQNPGFEQSVATFVDGIYRSRSRSSEAALFDIERVEILKGPQSTFFGANAIAGALNIATRKPGAQAAYDASALYGTGTGEYSFNGGITQPLSDTLSIRAAGRISGMQGYVEDALAGKGPRNRTELARLSLRWKPTGNFRSDLRVDYDHSFTSNAYSFAVSGCPPTAPFAIDPVNTCGRFLALYPNAQTNGLQNISYAPPTYAQLHYAEVGWTNALDIGGGTLSAVTGYIHQISDNRTDVIPFPIAGAVNGYDALPVTLGERFWQFSQELRFQSRSGGTLEYMFGAYFSESRLTNTQYTSFNFLPFGAFNPNGTTNAGSSITAYINAGEHDYTYSGFGAVTVRPTSRLRVNLGLRYSSIHKDGTRSIVFGTSANAVPSSYVPLGAGDQPVYQAIIGANPAPFPQPHRVDNKLMPSAGLQYSLDKGSMVYATYSNGFKAGGFGATSEPDEFDPETVNAYELGVKSRLLGGKADVSLALFRSDYQNLQESTVAFTASGSIENIVRNAASARAQGVELGGTLRLSPHVSLSSDIAWLDSTYQRFPNGTCTMLASSASPSCVQDLAGKTRAYAPHFSGNIAMHFIIPQGDNRITFDPTVYFTTGFYETATADPLLTQTGYTKFDARIGFGPSDQHWEVALIGRNLTDKRTAGFRQPITLALGSASAMVDPPRVVALQFSMKR